MRREGTPEDLLAGVKEEIGMTNGGKSSAAKHEKGNRVADPLERLAAIGASAGGLSAERTRQVTKGDETDPATGGGSGAEKKAAANPDQRKLAAQAEAEKSATATFRRELVAAVKALKAELAPNHGYERMQAVEFARMAKARAEESLQPTPAQLLAEGKLLEYLTFRSFFITLGGRESGPDTAGLGIGNEGFGNTAMGEDAAVLEGARLLLTEKQVDELDRDLEIRLQRACWQDAIDAVQKGSTFDCGTLKAEQSDTMLSERDLQVRRNAIAHFAAAAPATREKLNAQLMATARAVIVRDTLASELPKEPGFPRENVNREKLYSERFDALAEKLRKDGDVLGYAALVHIARIGSGPSRERNMETAFLAELQKDPAFGEKLKPYLTDEQLARAKKAAARSPETV